MLSSRQINLALLGGVGALTAALALLYAVLDRGTVTISLTAGVSLAFLTLCFVYWRGWEPARYVAVVVITLIAGLSLPGDDQLLMALVAPVLALVLAGPLWVVGSTLVMLALIVGQSGLNSAYLRSDALSALAICVGGLVLSRLALDSSRRSAEENAQRAAENARRADQRAAEISQQAATLGEQNERQRELLELVATLETPTVALADGVLLAPVVGNLDTRRIDLLMRRVLEAVYRDRARLVIIDIAGVAVVDTVVARALTDAVRAVHLLGCEVVITGISATVATTLVNLGATLDDLATQASPQEALAAYLEQGAIGGGRRAGG